MNNSPHFATSFAMWGAAASAAASVEASDDISPLLDNLKLAVCGRYDDAGRPLLVTLLERRSIATSFLSTESLPLLAASCNLCMPIAVLKPRERLAKGLAR